MVSVLALTENVLVVKNYKMQRIQINPNRYFPQRKPRVLILSELANKIQRTSLFLRIYLVGIPDKEVERLQRVCDVDAKNEDHWKALFWTEAKKLRMSYPQPKKPKQLTIKL